MSSEVKEQLRSIDEVPGPSPSVPFLGTTWIYFPLIGSYKLENLHEANVDKYFRYGKICREYFVYKRPCIHIYDPEDIEKVLRNQGKYPRRPANEAAVIFRNSHPELYSTVGLVNASGEEWHRLRNNLVAPLIQPRVVNGFIPQQSLICDDLVELLKEVRHPDCMIDNAMEPLHRLALESSAMFCLDTRMGCLQGVIEEGSDARRMIDSSLALFNAYQSLYYGSRLWKYVTTAAYKQMADAELTLYHIVSKFISEAKMKDEEKTNYEDAPRMAQLLRKAEGIDFKDIQTGIVDLITAGIDTTANSIIFFLNQLAENPKVQEKLYEEIVSVIGDGEVTASCLGRMPYLKACTKETFRLCPTIPNIVRILNDDMELSGYMIPKESTVICQTMVSAQLSDYVDHAEEFLPERWLPGYPNRCKPFCTQPFGCGPRMCPGTDSTWFYTREKMKNSVLFQRPSLDTSLAQRSNIRNVKTLGLMYSYYSRKTICRAGDLHHHN